MHNAPEQSTEPKLVLAPDHLVGALQVSKYLVELRQQNAAISGYFTDYDKTVGLIIDDILEAVDAAHAKARETR